MRLLRPYKSKANSDSYPLRGMAYQAYTEQSFREEFQGLAPEHFTDVLALAGDSADNVPGVKGIGPKTAIKLLKEFGDLDTIIANAPSIKVR